jgi:hypothetical protein
VTSTLAGVLTPAGVGVAREVAARLVLAGAPDRDDEEDRGTCPRSSRQHDLVSS